MIIIFKKLILSLSNKPLSLTRTHTPPAITNASNITLLPLSNTQLYFPKLIPPLLIGDSRLSMLQRSVPASVSLLHPYLTRSTSILTPNLIYLQKLTTPILIGDSRLSMLQRSVSQVQERSVPESPTQVQAYLSRSTSKLTLSPLKLTAIGHSRLSLQQSIPPSLYSTLFHKKDYISNPRLRKPTESRPTDAMDILTLKADYKPAQPVTETNPCPEDAIFEIKYATCKNSDLKSTAPKFRVHNLCAGFIEGTKVTHIIDPSIGKPNPDDEELMSILHATLMIEDDLAANGINEMDLKKIWWNDGKEDIKDFWAKRMLKHCQFSTGVNGKNIIDYASKIYKLSKKVVEGDGNELSLGDFLDKKEFKVGNYYDVKDLLPVLREYYGVDAYPTFIPQGWHHPSLFEVGVIHDADTEEKLDHPMANQVPKGKFLMRRI